MSELNPNAVEVLKQLKQTKSFVCSSLEFFYGDQTDKQLEGNVEYQEYLKIDDSIEKLFEFYQQTQPEEFETIIVREDF